MLYQNYGQGLDKSLSRCTDTYVAIVAKRKTLFDDRPVEINELTYVIKQDLSALNSQISSLQSLSKSQQSQASRGGAEQEGEHNKNVGRILLSRRKRTNE